MNYSLKFANTIKFYEIGLTFFEKPLDRLIHRFEGESRAILLSLTVLLLNACHMSHNVFSG